MAVVAAGLNDLAVIGVSELLSAQRIEYLTVGGRIDGVLCGFVLGLRLLKLLLFLLLERRSALHQRRMIRLALTHNPLENLVVVSLEFPELRDLVASHALHPIVVDVYRLFEVGQGRGGQQLVKVSLRGANDENVAGGATASGVRRLRVR